MKELLDEAHHFYSNSPNIFVTPVPASGGWAYNLFTKHLVYKSYLQAKEKYIRHVTKVDERWAGHIMEFLESQRGKQTFDYKWMKKNLTIAGESDEEIIRLLIFFQVIGLFKIKQYSPDIKKRGYELPILYKRAKGTIEV